LAGELPAYPLLKYGFTEVREISKWIQEAMPHILETPTHGKVKK
jgi:hypothetical protein